MQRRSWVSWVACLAVVAVCGSYAFARVIRDRGAVFLPGIDAVGVPDGALGGNGEGKLTYNTRSNRYHLTARATVLNESGDRYVENNAGGFGLGPVVLSAAARIKQDKFTVSKGNRRTNRARAHYNGVAIEDGLEAQL